jgi:hypothetical protein
MRITRDRIISVLGRAPKPHEVSEQQFDGFNDDLRKMAQMDWDQVPDEYLWYYFHDLAYVKLQPDLFSHLFPACLTYWYETLMRDDPASRGDSDFHYSLMRGQITEKMLSEDECCSLYEFFCDGVLDRIEAQHGFAIEQTRASRSSSSTAKNAWIYRLNTLGIVAPVVRPIWEPWWTLDHPGKAICAIMYASGLVYLKGENPIYGAWTPERGGGGPYLTEIDSPLFDWTWRAENLSFLKSTLSVEYIVNKLDQAANQLAAHPELPLARQVADDAKGRKEVIEIRISDLLDNLARADLSKDHWD